MEENRSQILIYQTENGETKLDVHFQDETVWLTQKLMAKLFQTSVPNINMHLKNIFEEGELEKKRTIKDFLIVQKEGSRNIKRQRVFYNLDGMENNKSTKILSSPEFGVDSRYKSLGKKLSDGKQLMEARLKRLNKQSRSQVIKAKLLQLKLRMEDYLKQPIYEEGDFFTNFLINYIDTIYNKRAMFAKDINITPVSLSQILNNHREPKEEFMFRLMLHSELTFKHICKFQKKTWYQVYSHEKICDTMANQNEWRPTEKKQDKIKHAVLK